MKISEMLVELQNILEAHGDVDCYTYESDYSNYYTTSLHFEEISVRRFDEDTCCRVSETVKAVVIEA